MKIGVLFDLDGTLLNTLEDLADAVNYILAQYGCPQRSEEHVRRSLGNGAEQLIRLSLPGREDDPPVAQVLADYQAYYAAHARIKTAPYAGIPEALEVLKKKYPLAIVSNKPDKATKILCKELFGDIPAWGESATCPRKPAPDMLRNAMQVLGVDTCVYVGDSEVDIRTAKNTGVPCVGVLWGFRDRACLEEAGARYLCENPADLPEIIEKVIEKEVCNGK